MRSRCVGLLAGIALVAAACAPAAPPPPTSAPAQPAPTTAPAVPPTAAPARSTAPSATASVAASPVASAAATKPSGALIKVRYGLPTSTPVITTVGVYFALDNGYFKDQGLDVTVTPYPGSTTAVRALLSRGAEVVETGGDTAFLARASGAPIKVIYGPIAKPTDVVVGSTKIASLKDLAGKTWAIAQPNDSSFVQAKLLAQRNGVDPNSIHFVAIGGPPARAAALIAGRADVTSMTILILKPILDAVDAGKLHVVASLAQEFPDLPLAYDITRDDLVQDQPDMLTRFVTAEMKGYRWAQQNPDQAAAVAEKYIKGVDPALMKRGLEGLVKLHVYGVNGGFSPDRIDQAQKLLVQLGALKSTLKGTDVATTRFIDAAKTTLGPAS